MRSSFDVRLKSMSMENHMGSYANTGTWRLLMIGKAIVENSAFTNRPRRGEDI